MPIQHAFNDWECKYCHKHHKLQLVALGCEQSHDIIYVPLKKEWIKNLLQFFVVQDENLLNKDLIKTLRKYSYNTKGDEA
jgi:hypothetical protein